MAQEIYMQLRNLTSTTQQIIHNGQPIRIGPYAEASFSETLAKLMLKELSPLVERADLFATTSEREVEKPHTVWIANMTGDPDAPDRVDLEPRYDSKRKAMVQESIENSAKKARPVVGLRRLKEREVQTDHGLFYASPAPKELTIAPYRRKEMLREDGEWLMARESMRLLSQRGSPPLLAYCLAPSDFEPTIQWSLDDLRLYLKTAWPDASKEQVGRAELNLRRLHGKKNEVAVNHIIENAKAEVFKRILFRVLFNRRIKPLTKAQFEAAKLEAEGKDVSEIQNTETFDLSATTEISGLSEASA